ncbi:serine/threonine protein kinase [Tropicimonas isoalkanivorans]|uniref:Serine/threonine protein kinase n=1 Tax=Tropicimonas isoalkanivorans TaxID=441112 RepID=A0A1I1KCP4_9RHOB|nr:serine/threonine-protein kinase [Tropicimonas isoalkanivorans]SFC58265.1 serine/threonine protein kinase [Tropicimonas isoalkanivorans]
MSSRTTPKERTKHSKFGDELPVGSTLLRGQYKIERYLNSGGFGITYLARNSLDRRVVIKECYPSFICCRNGNNVRVRSEEHAGYYERLLDMFRKEARALAMLEHPNIVRVHEVFSDNKTAYMALDFVEGRDLQSIISENRENFGFAKIRELMVTVLSAISHIHARGMLHRDISPDNILIEKSGNPVLIDFGSARAQAARDASAIHAVKDGYSPHEFYATHAAHSAASDLYSLGATFHYAITGEAPPPSPDRLAALAEGQADPYTKLENSVERFDKGLLASIDRAVSVLARDRMQSANEWLLEIDDHSHTSMALEAARNDARIDQLVSELTHRTNSELASILAEEREREEAELEQRLVEMERIKSEEEERKKSRAQAAKAAADAAAAEPVPTFDTDWRPPVETICMPSIPQRIDYIAKIARQSEERRGDRSRQTRDTSATGKKLVERAFWTLGPLFADDPTPIAGRAE